MKAMVLEKFNEPLVLREIEKPKAASGELLLHVMTCGVCATDYKEQMGAIPCKEPPIVMGHEVCGTVEAVGEGVEGWEVGDVAIAYIYNYCGECYACKQGYTNLCKNVKRIGITNYGGYAEYTVWPADRSIKVPKTIPYHKACVLVDGASTAYHALVTRGHVQKGDTLLIMGSGGLGTNAIQIAKRIGAVVFVADVDDKKLEIAKKLGADYVFNTTKCDLQKEIEALTDGNGVKFSADFAGIPVASEQAFRCLAPGGTQLQPGHSPNGALNLTYVDIIRKERSLLGCRACTMDDIRACVEMVEEGSLDPVIDRTAMLPLESAQEIIDRLKERKVAGRGVLLVGCTIDDCKD